MSDFFEELLIVLSNSTRTVAALSLCVIAPLLILILGDALTTEDAAGDQGIYQPLMQVALHGVYWRYVIAAVFSFLTFAGLAIRFYRAERSRLMHM